MVDDRTIAEAMAAATEGRRDALKAILEAMSPDEKSYLKGYVSGYVEAVRHLQEAGREAEVQNRPGAG